MYNNQLAISAMSEMPTNKQELSTYNDLVREAALSGEIDIIEIAKKINMMGRVVDFFEKDKEIQEALLSESEKYVKSERKDLQVKEVGVKYDYLECGHLTYNRLFEEKKAIEEQMKAIEQTLKVRDISEIDTETGEMFEARKANKSSQTKVIILLNK
jgi:hypothetical protein